MWLDYSIHGNRVIENAELCDFIEYRCKLLANITQEMY